jgi:hypothetical protein
LVTSKVSRPVVLASVTVSIAMLAPLVGRCLRGL